MSQKAVLSGSFPLQDYSGEAVLPGFSPEGRGLDICSLVLISPDWELLLGLMAPWPFQLPSWETLGQSDEEAGTWGLDSSGRKKGKALPVSIGASPRNPRSWISLGSPHVPRQASAFPSTLVQLGTCLSTPFLLLFPWQTAKCLTYLIVESFRKLIKMIHC